MSVLFLGNLPPPLNGSSIVTINILKYLKKRHNVIIIDTSISKTSIALNRIKLSKITTFLLILKKLSKVSEKKFQFVYITSNLNFIGVLKNLAFLLFIYNKTEKIYIHPHLYFENGKKLHNLFKVFKKINIITINRHLDGVKNFKYLPNTNFDEYNLKTNKHNFEEWNILFISNLYEFKGLYDLIYFAEILKQKKINYKISIIGSEGDLSYKDLKQHIASKNLENHVILYGPIFDKKLKLNFLKKANLVLYPTRKDFLPLFLIESINFGIPIISNNIGCIDQIIYDGFNGYLVENNEQFIERIFKLISDKELFYLFSRNSKQVYFNNYSNSIFYSKLDHIFSK